MEGAEGTKPDVTIEIDNSGGEPPEDQKKEDERWQRLELQVIALTQEVERLSSTLEISSRTGETMTEAEAEASARIAEAQAKMVEAQVEATIEVTKAEAETAVAQIEAQKHESAEEPPHLVRNRWL
jgi:multidrug efflux pump subunit AcrA (membrane-fusion protein)